LGGWGEYFILKEFGRIEYDKILDITSAKPCVFYNKQLVN
jgi:hypothetical protein